MRDKLLAAEKVKAIEWRDGKLGLLDQRVLPREETWLAYDSAAGVAGAIRSMVVRGAPAELRRHVGQLAAPLPGDAAGSRRRGPQG